MFNKKLKEEIFEIRKKLSELEKTSNNQLSKIENLESEIWDIDYPNGQILRYNNIILYKYKNDKEICIALRDTFPNYALNPISETKIKISLIFQENLITEYKYFIFDKESEQLTEVDKENKIKL